MIERLSKRVAIVTGGAQGIGRAIAVELLGAGASVLIVDADEAEAARTVRELAESAGDRIASTRADVSCRDDVAAAVGQCIERYGRLDVLAANAATADVVPLMEIGESAWRRMLDVNLTGAFFCLQEAARVMIPQGSGTIVVTASTNAFWVEANTAHYSASKAGAVALVQTAALDLAPHGIRVNAVSPGIVKTRLTRFLVEDPVEGAEYLKRIPLGRYAEPADIARVVAFLASDAAAYMTGENVVVDGGVTIGVSISPPDAPLPGAER